MVYLEQNTIINGQAMSPSTNGAKEERHIHNLDDIKSLTNYVVPWLKYSPAISER